MVNFRGWNAHDTTKKNNMFLYSEDDKSVMISGFVSRHYRGLELPVLEKVAKGGDERSTFREGNKNKIKSSYYGPFTTLSVCTS